MILVLMCIVIRLMENNSTQVGKRLNKAGILPFIPPNTSLQLASFLNAANWHL